MTRRGVFHSLWVHWQRLRVDDAYAAWCDANSRCGEALRAWMGADPAARRDAYHAYRAELEREEAAATELELHARELAA
jgi:hypothetical protein